MNGAKFLMKLLNFRREKKSLVKFSVAGRFLVSYQIKTFAMLLNEDFMWES